MKKKGHKRKLKRRFVTKKDVAGCAPSAFEQRTPRRSFAFVSSAITTSERKRMNSEELVQVGAVADSTLKLAANTLKLSNSGHPVACQEQFRLLEKVLTLVRTCFRTPKFAIVTQTTTTHSRWSHLPQQLGTHRPSGAAEGTEQEAGGH